MNQGTLPRWYTTNEAAEYMGARGGGTVRSWKRKGMITPDGRSGPGGAYLYRAATLDAFLEECLQKSLADGSTA